MFLPFFEAYQQAINSQTVAIVQAFESSSQHWDLGYRVQASAVFSSNIEGNSLDLNSYMNAKAKKKLFRAQKEVREIDDLVDSYHYAMENPLHESTFLKAHAILTQHILPKPKRGTYRMEPVGVFDENGLVYVAVEHPHVAAQMCELFGHINESLSIEQTVEAILYTASWIHLRLVHIHPFSDGNGRAARLLEKWFLTSKLGDSYWHLLSEKYYKEHQADYYLNINLGVNFYELDYAKCIPFLLMLPESFKG